MRGRRRSPGPPGGFRRDDRRYPIGGPRRRRSISPERFRRGGSPPPFKRGRYGRDPDDFYPPPRGYNPGYYGGRPSPHHQRERNDGPRTYKDFCRTLPDDVTPEEAQKEYQQYLAEYWGSEVKADFESKKGEEWMKRRFDPRGMQKALEERNEDAQKAATSFAEDLEAGILDPKAEDFNQGSGVPSKNADTTEGGGGEEDEEDEAGKGKPAEQPSAPTTSDVMWKPARIRSDIELSTRLVQRLDQEKGLEGKQLAFQRTEDEKEEEAQKDEATTEDGKEVGSGGNAQKPEGGANPSVENGSMQEDEYEEAIRKLDLQLTYLWKVHGVDYYGGKEFADPSQTEARAKTCRMLRGQRPEEGEQAPEAEEKKNLKAADKRVDQTWKKRMMAGDPFEAGLQKEKTGKLVEDWIEDQVKKIADNKWGCKLSQKLFVGRDYVVKHVRLKHTEKVEDQRNKILDEIFFENYKKFREEEQKLMQAELAKMQQAMHMQQGGGLPMPPWDGSGGQGAPVPESGAPGPGFAAAPLRPLGPQRMMMPGMMPGPGQMLVLAPGAGPMGPFISVPIADGHGMGPGMAPPRGPPVRGPGGRSRGGFFPAPFHGAMPGAKPDPRGVREYYDLDNPSNNRAVLDYGDL